MPNDFRSMPSRYPENSEALAGALADWARAYGELRPDVFGGAWLDYVGHLPVAFAAFTDDLKPHRSALDPRIRVVAASRTRTELGLLVDEIRRFVEGHPGTRLHDLEAQESSNGVLLHVESDNEDGFEHALRARFGTVIDLYFEQYAPAAMSFKSWRIDEASQVITVRWSGQPERDITLSVDESDKAVRLTLRYSKWLGCRRADSSVGEGYEVGIAGFGDMPLTASATLAGPLSGREVIDTQRRRRPRPRA